MFKTIFIGVCIVLGLVTSMCAQERNWNNDSTRQQGPGHKPETGPHKGRMVSDRGMKLEMVTPSGSKSHDVSYFVYDSLNNVSDNKLYQGYVKYVFGGPNEFLEARLSPVAVKNQYVASLEGWQEYKKAIVILKSGDKNYTFYFGNPAAFQNRQNAGAGQRGHHGGHHGGHGGGGNRQGGGFGGQGTNGF